MWESETSRRSTGSPVASRTVARRVASSSTRRHQVPSIVTRTKGSATPGPERSSASATAVSVIARWAPSETSQSAGPQLRARMPGAGVTSRTATPARPTNAGTGARVCRATIAPPLGSGVPML
ncbi:hypothetical protein IU11_19550 [Cellulosimicrobium sp. MM]|nr:hypothetical protein IU11_19550 [Cellulosimicrobium sp. MM]